MADVLADRFRRWFVYERDAFSKAVASLDTVPADRRDGREYRKAVALLGHLALARATWLHRLGAGPAPPGLFLDEDGVDLGQVTAEWRATADAWAAHLDRLTDADLARVFDYRSYDGGHFRNRVEDILVTTFSHSFYHRGQVAVLVKAAGGTPAVTDFVFWCREPVA